VDYALGNGAPGSRFFALVGWLVEFSAIPQFPQTFRHVMLLSFVISVLPQHAQTFANTNWVWSHDYPSCAKV